jgi:mycobactin peptide synthetase MbtE
MSSLSTLDSEDLETAVADESAMPATELERVIAQVWQEVLGVEAVGAEENFFDLGGHSLALVAAYERLRGVAGAGLTVMGMFEHASVRRLARHLSGGEAEAGAGARERARKQKAARQQQRTAKGSGR